MTKDEIMALFTEHARRRVEYPGLTRQEVGDAPSGRVTRHYMEGSGTGFIAYYELDETNADTAIQRELDFFQRERGTGFEWKVFDTDHPTDMIERLRARGFEIGERESLVILELTEDHPLLSMPIPAAIHPVTDEAGVSAIQTMEETVWNEEKPWLGKQLKDDLRDVPERLNVFAAWDGPIVTSAAWVYYHPGTPFAGLWGGSTLREYRQRGLYTGLLAARAQAAWQRGHPLLYVDASEMSRPILERRGFQYMGYSTPCDAPLPKKA